MKIGVSIFRCANYDCDYDYGIQFTKAALSSQEMISDLVISIVTSNNAVVGSPYQAPLYQ